MPRSGSVSDTFPAANQPAVYVIHENEEWVLPLREAFEEQNIPYKEWFVNEGAVELNSTPPEGVFYNRMSASSHTRSHRYAVELSEPLLAWLQAHKRRVVNGRRSLQLEVRKFEQYLALQLNGIRTPKTIAASGNNEILKSVNQLGLAPFIVKPNRGGKGQGVQLFNNAEELERQLSEEENISLDGIALVQEYIKPANHQITRMEFIGGQFYYAVEVDTSEGFELCPADACSVEDQFCPAPGQEVQKKFRLAKDFNDPALVSKLEAFFKANDIEIAAAEFVEDPAGNRYVYDINMNTNYNQEAERDAGNKKRGMHRIAEFLGRELERLNAKMKKARSS
ncbi:MAG: hypothetical protein WEA56_01590 [Balneolaceae bacterium]